MAEGEWRLYTDLAPWWPLLSAPEDYDPALPLETVVDSAV